MLIQQNNSVPQYVMIRNARQPIRTDRENRSSIKINTTNNQSLYQDERDRLQQLIEKSLQNPSQMEKSETATQSTCNTRTRIISQPHLDLKIKRKSDQLQSMRTNLQSRRGSQMARQNTNPISPKRSPSQKQSKMSLKLKSMKSEGSEQKQMERPNPPKNISQLSNTALINYHKRLVRAAQKILYFQSAKNK